MLDSLPHVGDVCISNKKVACGQTFDKGLGMFGVEHPKVKGEKGDRMCFGHIRHALF